jgi:(5-formylfuran-3-yl)methyl phosphate synthase
MLDTQYKLDSQNELNTQNKQHDLLSLQGRQALHYFTQQCQQHQLMCGLAGSLKPQYIDTLLEINPTYIGFRGGVCDNLDRKRDLNQAKLAHIVNMLRNGNKNRTKA